MNTEQLRQALRQKWLDYYRENRSWLVRLGVWVTCQGQRRPSSSFILATLAILEPQLGQLLPLVVDLSSNPDRIVAALGLNFNPDEALEHLPEQPRMLPEGAPPPSDFDLNSSRQPLPRELDESYAHVRPRPKVPS
ncbi:DUF5331 domain-containing protein [Sphaerothrix gracilis]|uniref:DUF5331 domain-containing protein n=1 Tax=Sphaerothrix gracilis TaxID=3151835 RepID=UPI0031FDFF52